MINTEHHRVCQKVQKLRSPVQLQLGHQIFRFAAEGLSTCNIVQNNWKGVVNNVAENYPYLDVLVKKKKKRISKHSPSKVWWAGL